MNIEWNKVTWYSKATAVVLGLTIFLLGLYLGNQLKDAAEFQDISLQDSVNATMMRADEKMLLTDFTHMIGPVLNFYNNGLFVAYVLKPAEQKNYTPNGNQGTTIEDTGDITILNTATADRRTFDSYLHLASSSMMDALSTSSAPLHYYMDSAPVAWSAATKDTLWGRVSLYSSGDPRINNAIGYVKINANNGHVEQYPLPHHESFGTIQENMNINEVTYEAIDRGTVSFYVYNFDTKEEHAISRLQFEKSADGNDSVAI